MEVRNARYIDATRIDCEINHPVYGWIPYTLDPNDTDTTIDNNVLLEAIGSDVVPYNPPSSEEVEAAAAKEAELIARANRDMLLAETDWWASSDLTMTQEQVDYRQALRDIPQQPGFPDNITWPDKP